MSGHAPSGLAAAPQLQWGSHLTQFFGEGSELRDILVPYFKAGLENNERCFWVTGTEFTADQARSALRAAVPDLDIRERGKQIEITNAGDWYAPGAKLRPRDIVADLLQRENNAFDVGYAGLRTSGNCAWVSQEQWADFQDYEALVQDNVRSRRMICMCNYCTDQMQDGRHMDVMAVHDMVIPGAKRPSKLPRLAASVIAQEMQHRVNNTLMSVLAIMNASFRQSATMEHFKANFTARIAALSKTHAMLTSGEQSSISFVDLLGSELDMFTDGDKARVQMSGTDFTLSERVAVPVAMAIHELATNAAKYGALSRDDGKLSVGWELSQDVAHLDWRELNVPVPQHRTRVGFGTRLLKKILPAQIGAQFAIEYQTDGVRASLSFPVR